MKFRGDDELLSMAIIGSDMDEDDRFVFTVTDQGFAKRSKVSDYREQNRGGLGIKAMKLNEDRGHLVGGLVVSESDEVIAIKVSGQITRSAVAEVPAKGRDTMGVRFVRVKDGDQVTVIALNPEEREDLVVDEDAAVDETSVDNISDDDMENIDGAGTVDPSTEGDAPDQDAPADVIAEDEQEETDGE